MDHLSLADQAKLLRGFLSGAVRSADLRDRLAGHMSIEGNWGNFSIEIAIPLQVHVAVSPEDLRPMLERYLAWKVEDDELARWAALVVMLDSYTNPLGLSQEESDALMDPMWDLLSDLSAPAILGMPLRERVIQGLPELARLQAKIAARAV